MLLETVFVVTITLPMSLTSSSWIPCYGMQPTSSLRAGVKAPPYRLHVQREARIRLSEEVRPWEAKRRLETLSFEYGEFARISHGDPLVARRALSLAIATRQLAREIEVGFYSAASQFCGLSVSSGEGEEET